jgi:esterase/lipase
LWLGSPARPLFCWLDAPDDGQVEGVAVICPSMGLESVYSSRALRELALRLAASRWGALRLDYPGTGDSAGTWTDPGLVEEWLDAVRAGIEYARSLGAPRVSVVGLRLGATLAAAELDRGEGVDDLVLWDPCASGRAFLREQRALWAFLRDQATEWGILGEDELWGSGEVSEDGSFEAPGTMFSAPTVAALEALAIAGDDLASRELVLARRGRRLDRALSARRALSHVESVEVGGQEDLLQVEAITPEDTLLRVVSWLTDVPGPAVRLDRPRPQAAALHRAAGQPGVLERPVELGPARLFGMLSEPEHGVDPAGPTVIFLNAGRMGHQGPARLWVDLARSWAAAGLRCLRVDLSGIGDSPTRPGRTELVEFPSDALVDVDDIRRAVAADGTGAIALVGLCSGGYHAIESALRAPVASVCAINPVLTFDRWREQPYRRFDPGDGSAGPHDSDDLGATRPWTTRLLARLAPLRKMTRRMPDSGWWFLDRLRASARPAQILGRLADSGVDVLVVAGPGEARLLTRSDRRAFRALVGTGRLRMETVPHLEHSLLERTGRARVAELLRQHVVHGAGTGAVPDLNRVNR